jgi:uncharacterized protein YigE (DUF2233 family)
MKKFFVFAVMAGLTFACTSVGRAANAEPACGKRTFEGAAFTVCAASLATSDVRLFLKRVDGTNFGDPEALPHDGLLFATNAGMFGASHAPIGLYVEGGRQVHALNTKTGGGNFHLQPNGVFWINDGKAAITVTAEFAAAKPEADWATQSGPMLVINGALNSNFDANGPSRYVRNGAGVSDAKHIYVAISDEPVSFGIFARLFRDELKCLNALYLDGAVSRLYHPGLPEGYGGSELGPLLGVYARQ